MDRVWAPWRLDYVTGARQTTGCVFCLSAGPSNEADAAEREALVVFRGITSYVVLNLYPYNNGHLLIVPFRHVATLAALSADEMLELGVLAQRAEMALNQAYQPHGLNVGINLGKPAGAGVLDHVHIHVVPRWNGDTNFMTVIGEARVLPEDLASSATRLRPIFQKLGRAG